MFAVAYGELFDAINFIGPFETFDEAEGYADFEIGSGNSWWVVELENPRPETLDFEDDGE